MLDYVYQQWQYHHLGKFNGQGVVDILILQIQYKLTILGLSGMLVHPHQKSLYQFERDFHVCLHVKTFTLLLSWDISKK